MYLFKLRSFYASILFVLVVFVLGLMFNAPLVLGRRRYFFGSMNSRMLANGSCFPLRSARRKATVTISVPLAARASRMTSLEENFPVPTRRREENSRPAIFKGPLIPSS